VNFKDILGNEKAKEILLKSLNNKTVLHSYMFIGNAGIGKRLIATQFSKMILCQNFDEQNLTECGKCKSCIEFDGGNNPDFKTIEPDGKIIKIEQIREMQNKIIEKPIISNKKVYIINDADLMTKEAQNCLLKTLEEPPEYIVIILIVGNESKMLTTIKSRCMKIQFKKIEDEMVKQYLQEKCEINSLSESVLKLCDGSIGKALKIKDKLEEYNKVENIINNMNQSLITVLNTAEILYKSKDDIYDYLEYINVILYQLLKENVNYSSKFMNCIKIVEETKQRLLANSNYDMSIDRMLFKIWEEINEKNSWS
jgi:DNA polymerase-3 subunit delta'